MTRAHDGSVARRVQVLDMRSDAVPDVPGEPALTAGAGAAPFLGPALRARPRLRGVSHQIAALAAVPAVGALVLRARSGAAVTAALVYGVTLVLLFSVSAVYHRLDWPLPARRWIGRVDHSAIFLLIAGTYTPLCLLLGVGAGERLLAAVWIAAAAGIASVVWLTRAPKPIRASLYVLLGWFVLPAIPAIRAVLGDRALALLLLGGLFYTVGAAIYALRRPDPSPQVFGFHEIFHLLVIAAAICHYVVVDAAVRALR